VRLLISILLFSFLNPRCPDLIVAPAEVIYEVQTPKSNHASLEAKQSAGVQKKNVNKIEFLSFTRDQNAKAGAEVNPVSYLYSL
jgi:hypothetical protein